MNLMKHILITLMAVAVASSALAAEKPADKPNPFADAAKNEKAKAAKVAAATPAPAAAVATAKKIFNEHELGLESAYVLRTEDFDKYKESVLVGLNYFHTEGVGFHAGVGFQDTDDQGIDWVEFGPVGRLTLKKVPLAFTFGVGAEAHFVNDREADTREGGGKGKDFTTISAREDWWAVYAEGGATFRVWKHLDLFGKIRGVRPIAGAEKEHVAILTGVNIPWQLKF